jgi:xylulokinase
VILAVDLGSTSFKAGVFDDSFARRSAGRAELTHVHSPGGGVELDVTEVESAFAGAIRAALAGIDAGELRAVALTSQAQTFTVLDPGGRARDPFISWQDTSAEESLARLGSELPMNEFAEHCSFARPIPALQVCHLRKMRGSVGADERVVSLPTYFTLKLGGELAVDDNLAAMGGLYFTLKLGGELAVDDNLAAMGGLYSMREGRWWPAALEACGLSEDQLPRVLPIGSVAGRTGEGAEHLGIPRGLPLVLAGNDQTAGAYGAGVHLGERVLVTLGTAHVAYTLDARCGIRDAGSSHSSEAQSAIQDPESEIVRGPYPGGRGYVMIASGAGGNLVNWARELLGCAGDDEFFALARDGEPAAKGLSFEVDVFTATASWRGLELGTTRADLARSVLETLADGAAEMLGALAPEPSGVELLVAGGGSRQALWLELIGARLGSELRAVDADPLLGAAMMGRAAVAEEEHET